MLTDRYDNELATTSAEARDLYVEAVDTLLGAGPDMTGAFAEVAAADPGFMQAHTGHARACQIMGDGKGARAAIARAREAGRALSEQAASHLHVMGLLIDGRATAAYPAIRAHVAAYPRDVLLAQTCTSVFGLIGFSGEPGREADLLAYTTSLAPHYGEDDWWFLSQHAFSLCETGRLDPANDWIERSLARNPRNAHGAHVRAHIYYEAGETDAGVSYLEGWLPGYDRAGLMHGHISWHMALWSLAAGDTARMWDLVDGNVRPGVSQGLPVNVLTDTAAILYRAELAGVAVAPERWREISDYAKTFFPKCALGFADAHAAMAHAMAGEDAALEAIIAAPVGPAADIVRESATAYRAMAKGDWAEAAAHMTACLADHARLGGSRAQRDLLDHTLLSALLKLGRSDEARRLLALRRPILLDNPPVAGLLSH